MTVRIEKLAQPFFALSAEDMLFGMQVREDHAKFQAYICSVNAQALTRVGVSQERIDKYGRGLVSIEEIATCHQKCPTFKSLIDLAQQNSETICNITQLRPGWTQIVMHGDIFRLLQQAERMTVGRPGKLLNWIKNSYVECMEEFMSDHSAGARASILWGRSPVKGVAP